MLKIGDGLPCCRQADHSDLDERSHATSQWVGLLALGGIEGLVTDNFINFGMGAKKGPDGRYAITLPMGSSRMSGIAAEDIGRCAFGIFQAGSEYAGKTVGIASDHLTGVEIARTFTEVLGVEVVYSEISPEVYRGFGFPGADDLGNMFQFYRDFADEFTAARSVDLSRKLNPKLQSLRKWLEANKSAIPLEA